VPGEIEDAILNEIGTGMLTFLIEFIRFTLPQLRNMKAQMTFELYFNDATPFLQATTTSFFGSIYLDQLNLSDSETRHEKMTISVRTGKVHGIRVVYGDNGRGLLAIALLYEDGSTCDYMGTNFDNNLPQQTILGQDVHGLRVHRDVGQIINWLTWV